MASLVFTVALPAALLVYVVGLALLRASVRRRISRDPIRLGATHPDEQGRFVQGLPCGSVHRASDHGVAQQLARRWGRVTRPDGSGGDLQVVTGAFGYSGRYIAARLLAAGKAPRTLTNSLTRQNPFGIAVEARPYNFDKPDEMVRSLQGARVLINSSWVRFDHRDFTHSQAVRNTLPVRCCEAGWSSSMSFTSASRIPRRIRACPTFGARRSWKEARRPKAVGFAS